MSTQTENKTVDFQSKVLEIVKELGWEKVHEKLTTETKVVTKEGSKMSKAVVIFQEMIGVKREFVIKRFMSELDMSKEGAGTYYQSVKKKING